MSATSEGVTTLATLRSWAARRERFGVFTCYDATTARWLARGGARVLLVGDSAAQWMLGLDRSGRPSLDYMATIGAAVVRGAPRAFVIVDYPDDLTGSVEDHARRIRRLAEASGAGAVKVEAGVEALQELLSEPQVRSIPVVAHLGHQAGGDRCIGEPGVAPASGRTLPATLAADLRSVVGAGAIAVLLQEVAPRVAAEALREIAAAHPELPVLGCHSGDACVGEVEMLHALLGLGQASPSSPNLGEAISEAARRRIAALR